METGAKPKCKTVKKTVSGLTILYSEGSSGVNENVVKLGLVLKDALRETANQVRMCEGVMRLVITALLNVKVTTMTNPMSHSCSNFLKFYFFREWELSADLLSSIEKEITFLYSQNSFALCLTRSSFLPGYLG